MQVRKNRCDATETEVFGQPLEQEFSGQAEGESDLRRMCHPGKSCRNQVGSQL